MKDPDKNYECGVCIYFDGNHACLHPEHRRNVNPWHLCPDIEFIWEDV